MVIGCHRGNLRRRRCKAKAKPDPNLCLNNIIGGIWSRHRPITWSVFSIGRDLDVHMKAKSVGNELTAILLEWVFSVAL